MYRKEEKQTKRVKCQGDLQYFLTVPVVDILKFEDADLRAKKKTAINFSGSSNILKILNGLLAS